ncbi:MAG TPA: metal ABC transporter permease [Solirubrobacteraceae bacterium]|nr:metal ABC transporter permease [Solirubrobacteraceae bacterium]
MEGVLRAIVEPGFWASPVVRLAAELGGAVTVVAAIVGVFTVLRGQSFAAEAVGDIGASGGSSAFLFGVGPLVGFVAFSAAAAAVLELIGVQRVRGRDVATGIVLGLGFGLTALFLYLDSSRDSASGATATILFGSIFAIPGSALPLVLLLGGLTVGLLGLFYRPLMLVSINPELAAARGVSPRLIGFVYLLALATAVALAAETIGAILSTTLVVGPAASALRLTGRPARALLVAVLIGLACTWGGLLLAWDSYYWPPLHHGWPASFFIVALVLVSYLLAGTWAARSGAGS